MTKNSTILITGGCGYIGSHIVRMLSESSWTPIVVDDLSTGFADALIGGEQFINGDIADFDLLYDTIKKFNIKHAIHMAASVIASESTSRPDVYHTNNVANSIHLLNACTKAGIENFIFSSTAAVYGESKNGQVSEADSTLPISPYGRSKLLTEQIIQDYAKAFRMNYVILRYFNVAGADPMCRIGQRTKNATHLIKVTCEAALQSEPKMSVYGNDYGTADGTCLRDYVHVQDIASAHLAALSHLQLGNPSDIFNCGYGRGYSVLDVIREVEKQSGKKIKINFVERRQGDIECLTANNSKILKTLEWHPKFDTLPKIIKTALAWEKKRFKEL
jgi:UDP-glucose 4-epimerase